MPRDDAVGAVGAAQELRREHRLADAAAAHEPQELRGVGRRGVEPREDLLEGPLARAREVRPELLVPQVREVVRLQPVHLVEAQVQVQPLCHALGAELAELLVLLKAVDELLPRD